MEYTTPIELGIAEKLKKDEGYRRVFFRAFVTDSIALQIQQLRKLHALKQSGLAAAAGMKQSAISRIEQAEYSSWTFNTLSRVAEALKARLIITFQPMEEAISEYENAERGIPLAQSIAYSPATTIPNEYARTETILVGSTNLSISTDNSLSLRIADTQGQLVRKTSFGATKNV